MKPWPKKSLLLKRQVLQWKLKGSKRAYILPETKLRTAKAAIHQFKCLGVAKKSNFWIGGRTERRNKKKKKNRELTCSKHQWVPQDCTRTTMEVGQTVKNCIKIIDLVLILFMTYSSKYNINFYLIILLKCPRIDSKMCFKYWLLNIRRYLLDLAQDEFLDFIISLRVKHMHKKEVTYEAVN